MKKKSILSKKIINNVKYMQIYDNYKGKKYLFYLEVIFLLLMKIMKYCYMIYFKII